MAGRPCPFLRGYPRAGEKDKRPRTQGGYLFFQRHPHLRGPARQPRARTRRRPYDSQMGAGIFQIRFLPQRKGVCIRAAGVLCRHLREGKRQDDGISRVQRRAQGACPPHEGQAVARRSVCLRNGRGRGQHTVRQHRRRQRGRVCAHGQHQKVRLLREISRREGQRRGRRGNQHSRAEGVQPHRAFPDGGDTQGGQKLNRTRQPRHRQECQRGDTVPP